jgi:hypothetical protein
MVGLSSQVGRIRANDVELRDDEDTVVYKSPPAGL